MPLRRANRNPEHTMKNTDTGYEATVPETRKDRARLTAAYNQHATHA